MLDIKLIRENPNFVEENLKKRGNEEKIKLLHSLIENDKKYRENLKELEKLKHEKNVISDEIANLKKQGKDVSKKIKEASELPKKIKKLEEEVLKQKEMINFALLRIPNLIHDSVPIGKSEEDNVVIRTYGKPPKFDFQPKNHLEILKGLGLIDDERAEKVVGRGFFYLKDSLALLDRALQTYAIDFLMKKGYTFIYPPHMLRRKPYEGMVDLADFENMMYKIENEDLYLIATAEHPIGAMFKDEIINKKDLPMKFVGFSTNFRKEVGSHGKYTKGLFRMHQFNKVEQFIFCLPEDSWKYHEELQKNSEELYKNLGLHFRTVVLCSAETGVVSAKTYDIELWMADGVYREVGSNSNCLDYQARRLNIRYREKEGQAPAGFVHTLNNTAIATSRTMVALIEQFQQKDGTVLIPKVLWPYMNGIKKLDRLI
ncbi:MAG: serine--tRNA ligase [Candidatus Aenigmatarchaeota archaeon]